MKLGPGGGAAARPNGYRPTPKWNPVLGTVPGACQTCTGYTIPDVGPDAGEGALRMLAGRAHSAQATGSGRRGTRYGGERTLCRRGTGPVMSRTRQVISRAAQAG